LVLLALLVFKGL
jgi:hypothetical protein